jgi:hypothetical protein
VGKQANYESSIGIEVRDASMDERISDDFSSPGARIAGGKEFLSRVQYSLAVLLNKGREYDAAGF